MALASTIEINSGAISPTGILVALAPGADPNVPLELWRAPDSAGAPDTANALMVFSGVVPPSGFAFFDQMAKTAATFWYRSRLNGAAYGPSPYNDWVNVGAPDRVSLDALNALMAGDSTQRSTAWDQLNARIGSHSQQMLPNFGFEDGLAFWGAGAGLTTVIDNTKAHSGNKYFQVTSTTGVGFDTFAADNVGGARYFEVTPGDVVQWGGWAYRESGTANVRYRLRTVNKDLGSPADYLTPNQNTAAWAYVQGQLIVPAGVKYVRFHPDVDSTGTATVARFDDTFLRIAFATSTPHNPNGGMLPFATPNPGSFFSYAGGGPGTPQMWTSFGWSSANIARPDGSTITVPAPPAAPAAPTLSQVAGGALAARTRWAKVAYVKVGVADEAGTIFRTLYPVSTNASFAIGINNLLKVTSPADPGGGVYDGWCVLVGSASGSEYVQNDGFSNPLIAFGTDWTELATGFSTTANSLWTASWKSITVIRQAVSTTHYYYPHYDIAHDIVRFLATLSASSPKFAAIQNGDGMMSLGQYGSAVGYSGVSTFGTPAGGLTNSGNVGGGRLT